MVRVKAQAARRVAEALKAQLEPCCERIEIAGSLRRQRPEVGDIELLVIPRRQGKVDLLDKAVKRLLFDGVLGYRRNSRGSLMYGPKNKFLLDIESRILVDIFSTDEQCWPVALVVRTGGKATNKRIATAAIRKGWRFRAYGRGYNTPDGEEICHSEREVFEKAGLPYLEPWERE